MDKNAPNPQPHAVQEKWWHFAIVGVVLTVVAVTVLGSTFAGIGPSPATPATQQAQGVGGASLIEVSSAPNE